MNVLLASAGAADEVWSKPSDDGRRLALMKRTLLARVERLETRPETGKPLFFRYGWLHALPDDYAGERHVAIVSREPTRTPNVEWCVLKNGQGSGRRSTILKG